VTNISALVGDARDGMGWTGAARSGAAGSAARELAATRAMGEVSRRLADGDPGLVR